MFYGPAGLREVLVWLWLGLVWLPLAEGVERYKCADPECPGRTVPASYMQHRECRP